MVYRLTNLLFLSPCAISMTPFTSHSSVPSNPPPFLLTDFLLLHLLPTSNMITNTSKVKTFSTRVASEIDSNIRSNGKVIPTLTIPGNLPHTLPVALLKNSTADTLRNPLLLHAESTLFLSSHPPTKPSGISNFTSFKPPVFPLCTHKFSLFSMSFIHISRVNLWAHYVLLLHLFSGFLQAQDSQYGVHRQKAQWTSPLREGYCHGFGARGAQIHGARGAQIHGARGAHPEYFNFD